MVGPEVIELGFDDAMLEEVGVIKENIFDDLGAVDSEDRAELEIDTCVIWELRPDAVPFDGRKALLLIDADESVL